MVETSTRTARGGCVQKNVRGRNTPAVPTAEFLCSRDDKGHCGTCRGWPLPFFFFFFPRTASFFGSRCDVHTPWTMSGLDSPARGVFSPMSSVVRSMDPGASEFDSFIHADLCATSAPDGAGQGFNIVPYGPMVKSEEDLPLWGATSAPEPPHPMEPDASGALRVPDASGLRVADSHDLRVPDTALSGSPLWATSVAHDAAFRTFAPKQDGPGALSLIGESMDASAAWFVKDESAAAAATPATTAVREPEKRARLSCSPDRARQCSVPPTASSSSSSPSSVPAQRRSSSGSSRRLPPSASQVTESGHPFPVIDTSAKHSSLFVPPDTSGLTKREARLVKNRAAAFLSRQRKREQFEELAAKCRVLARLSWLLWDTLGHTVEPDAAAASIERVLAATSLGKQLPHEAEDMPAVLQQVVAQRGSMIVESIMGDDASFAKGAKPDAAAQLAAAQKEAEELREEVAKLRAAAPAAELSQMQPPPAVSFVDVSRQFSSAMRGLRRTSETDAIHELLGAAETQALQLRVALSPDTATSLCTVTSEAGVDSEDEKRWRCSTPADTSSDASAPSLCSNSASPTLSSMSSGSGGSHGAARRARRVLAFGCGDDACAVRPLTALDASQLRGLCAVDVDAWAAAHAYPLLRGGGTGDGDACADAARELDAELAASQLDVAQGCLVLASVSSDAGLDEKHARAWHVSVHGARRGAAADGAAAAHAPAVGMALVRVIQEALRVLGDEPVSPALGDERHARVLCASFRP